VLETNKLVNAESEYHLSVSDEQVADKVEELPLQIVLGEALSDVGAFGIAVTVTEVLALALLQEPETHAA
jgi:hypothetical protein